MITLSQGYRQTQAAKLSKPCLDYPYLGIPNNNPSNIPDFMKHFIFCAANIPENQTAIDNALKVADKLKYIWEMEAETTGIYDGSDIIINHNDGNNTSICIQDTDLHRLIQSCCAFTKEITKLKYK